MAFVKAFVESGKPVAAICHAPWTLVEADVVRGKRLTSWPSLQTDIRNAGGEWVDEEVVVDGNLVTSRKPDDLPAFNEALLEAVADWAAAPRPPEPTTPAHFSHETRDSPTRHVVGEALPVLHVHVQCRQPPVSSG